MEPIVRPQATLVDLLDRVLERGLVINADLVISLAGVPLVAINLRATLAGVETLKQYGILPGIEPGPTPSAGFPEACWRTDPQWQEQSA